MAFRQGMTKSELTKELRSKIEHFSPEVAEMTMDATRWQYCTEQRGFPRLAYSLVKGDIKEEMWYVEWGTLLVYGATPAEAVDRAIMEVESR